MKIYDVSEVTFKGCLLLAILLICSRANVSEEHLMCLFMSVCQRAMNYRPGGGGSEHLETSVNIYETTRRDIL
jgi:hypothetical protein